MKSCSAGVPSAPGGKILGLTGSNSPSAQPRTMSGLSSDTRSQRTLLASTCALISAKPPLKSSETISTPVFLIKGLWYASTWLLVNAPPQDTIVNFSSAYAEVPNSIPEINIASGAFVIRDMFYSFGRFLEVSGYGCWTPCC